VVRTNSTKISSDGAKPLPCDDALAWWVYVLVSNVKFRTYVGISTDPVRRIREHNGEEKGGAKSTRAARPWELARLFGPYAGRGEAQRRERALKRIRGRKRLTCSESDFATDE
jgi:putative endonuclease